MGPVVVVSHISKIFAPSFPITQLLTGPPLTVADWWGCIPVLVAQFGVREK
jgi:hypothetical protein